MGKIKLVCAVSACVLVLSGCQNSTTADTQNITDGIKEAFRQQVVSFFENDDLSKSFGIDSSRQKELEQSIQNYIDDYDLDEDAIDQAKAAVYEVLEDAKNFLPEQLDEKIADIFRKKN